MKKDIVCLNILLLLFIIPAMSQKKDSTDIITNFKWEVGYSLPTKFTREAQIGQSILVKKSFLTKYGTKKAYRFGLTFIDKTAGVIQTNNNYKAVYKFFSPEFGVERKKRVGKKLLLLNGYQVGVDFSLSKALVSQSDSNLFKGTQFSVFGDYFVGFKYLISKNISISSESSLSIFYTTPKNIPYNPDYTKYNLDIMFLPLKRLYLSYNF